MQCKWTPDSPVTSRLLLIFSASERATLLEAERILSKAQDKILDKWDKADPPHAYNLLLVAEDTLTDCQHPLVIAHK